MDSTVIVALPAIDDKVWRISSEKIPHLTILYLGDAVSDENFLSIVEHTRHAASFLDPFGLPVDYRGILGGENADVVFFDDRYGSLDNLRQFRHHLLLDDTIKRAYDSVEQFPEWTPHLTLGFPATPAREDTDDYPGINYVHFDRIAVWNEDYDGPEFRLKHDETAMEVARMGNIEAGAEAAERVLTHYGVRGMKWGVRNDKGHEGEQVKTKNLDKLDKKWEKNEERNAFWQAHNAAADKMNNGEIDRINNKPEHDAAAKAGKFNDWDNPTPELQAYMKDMDDTFNKHFADAVVARGSNPSGTKRYELKTDEDGNVYAELTDIKHASVGDVDVRYKISKDENGLITKYTLEEIAQLAHYGVKGMKWGVTKVDRAASVTQTREKTARRSAKEVTVTQRKAGTYVKTRGGQRQKASDDAVKAQAGRQKAKKSTTDSLTNDELKATIERMRLEQEFAKLDKKVSRRGQGFISRFFQSSAAKETAEDLLKRVAATS